MRIIDRIPGWAKHGAGMILPARVRDRVRRYIVDRYYEPGFINRQGPIAYRLRRHVLHRPPRLHRLVYHITDHCNLNCRGCTHFSNIAKPSFLQIDTFKSEFNRMSQLFPDITEVYLLGGEPLLHRDIEEFLLDARSYFPRTRINLLTNGVLVTRMPQTFWDTLRETDAWLMVNRYPIGLPVEEIARLAERHGVNLEWVDSRDEFFKLPLDIGESRTPPTLSGAAAGSTTAPCCETGSVSMFVRRLRRSVQRTVRRRGP